jgi:DedD protein
MSTLWEEQLEVVDAMEVQWGISTIMAIFFAASLISAVFFGMGYSFGRGGTLKSVSSTAYSDPAGPTAESTSAQTVQRHSGPIVTRRDATASASDTHRSSDNAKPMHAALTKASAIQSANAANVPAKTAQPAPADTRSKTVETGAAQYMVQVGAIGNRKDAKTLVSHLRKRGFYAEIYPGRRDKFLHVQIGPFATASQAQTMRHHVIASGYHAILKHAS